MSTRNASRVSSEAYPWTAIANIPNATELAIFVLSDQAFPTKHSVLERPSKASNRFNISGA